MGEEKGFEKTGGRQLRMMLKTCVKLLMYLNYVTYPGSVRNI